MAGTLGRGQVPAAPFGVWVCVHAPRGLSPGDPAAAQARSTDPAAAGDTDADAHGRAPAAPQPHCAHHAPADPAEPAAAR